MDEGDRRCLSKYREGDLMLCIRHYIISFLSFCSITYFMDGYIYSLEIGGGSISHDIFTISTSLQPHTLL